MIERFTRQDTKSIADKDLALREAAELTSPEGYEQATEQAQVVGKRAVRNLARLRTKSEKYSAKHQDVLHGIANTLNSDLDLHERIVARETEKGIVSDEKLQWLENLGRGFKDYYGNYEDEVAAKVQVNMRTRREPNDYSDYRKAQEAVGRDAGDSTHEPDTFTSPKFIPIERANIEYEASGEEQAQALANVFHEVWLRTRNKRSNNGAIFANGEREAREKKTNDEDWIKASGKAEAMVDIANTGFVKLPEDWKAENSAAANVIVELIKDFGGADHIDLSDPEVYAKCGAKIHDRWLERNTYAKGGELDVPFEELSADEQAKDLEQLQIALELFKPEKEGVPSRPFETRALQTVNNWALERWLPIRTKNGDLVGADDPVSWMYYQDQRDALMASHR
ncbi:MAG: hypothetical protein V4611_04050 [Patescibacteria group bacterium]